MAIKAQGLLIVVTGPSAVGKGTICQELIKEQTDIKWSVSCTTRKPRPSEIDGVEYFFVSREEFERRMAAGELLEWAEVYGNMYGTPRRYVDEMTQAGYDVILDIDMVGARKVRENYTDALWVFVIPPSMQTLKERIIRRGSEDAAAVERRLQEAPRWIEEGRSYDYVIVNDDLPTAVNDLRSIIFAEKHRTSENRLGALLIRHLLEKGELDSDD